MRVVFEQLVVEEELYISDVYIDGDAANLTYMFTEGRGGVPGNNDSGGLCSCYLWNALGVFPVSGQDLMIIGSPRSLESTLRLGNGKEFTIKKQGRGIY